MGLAGHQLSRRRRRDVRCPTPSAHNAPNGEVEEKKDDEIRVMKHVLKGEDTSPYATSFSLGTKGPVPSSPALRTEDVSLSDRLLSDRIFRSSGCRL
jgi:hypothetical protein